MNRYDLIQRIYSATDRNPNSTGFKNEVIGYLNDCMLNLAAADKWLFLERRASLTVYPDYTTGTVTVTNGSRLVNHLNTALWGAHMDGHWFIGPDGRTYTIAWVNAASTTLYLTESYQGTSGVLQSYTIRFFAYALPSDCIEPGPLTDRENDFGRIHYIDTATEANNYLDRDDTGDPRFYMPAGAWHTRTLDAEFTAAVAAGGLLTANTTYRYVVTVYYEGAESAPSKVVSATTTAANMIVNLSGLQNFLNGTEVGYRKRIYRDDGPGVFYYLTETTGIATTYSDTGAVASNLEAPLQELGEVHKVWFYPRTDTKTALEIWYKRRPRRMQKDQDSPDWPPEFQDVLWRAAAVEVARKYNQPTTTLEQVLEERLTMMRRRYLIRTDRQWRMGNSWAEVPYPSARQYRFGTATKI